MSPAPQPGDEPVAAVAAALLPATVQIETPAGLGSGFIYDSVGYILTAGHVVDDFQSVTVRLSDGTQLDGTVIGTDPGTDVAVVEIDSPAYRFGHDSPHRKADVDCDDRFHARASRSRRRVASRPRR
ncbi:MAG: S1C family serine protease [Acidimicrobiia bacterium]|nr:S1C family serine protease [Acidimicrobiia bacterium]